MVALMPTKFKSYSQAGQDRFVHALLGGSGTFLEIGSNNPITNNNTYGLERLGWTGLCCDNSGESMLACEKERTAHFYLTDAAQPQNWQAALAQAGLPIHEIDYLSLDVDEATMDCLIRFPLDMVSFGVITLEHDAYRFGTQRRDDMVAILKQHKYTILCADVMDQGLSFEIWAVDPKLVNMEVAAKFRRSQPTEWREFFK
jgi:hypothetical protein